MEKSVKLVNGVYVHTIDFNDSCYSQHVKVQSEKHARRICGLLNWEDRHGGPGRFFRSTWYDAGKKQLISRCGMDI